MYLQKYKNAFGQPNKGVHAYRVANIALIDLTATVLAAYLIAHYTNSSFFMALLILVLLAIFFHWLFGVQTTLNKIIFSA